MMSDQVIRHIHKYAKAMYVMVSIPEIVPENRFKSPVVLGIFSTKEAARSAWKARTADYRIIKAKTVHIYYESLLTDDLHIPDTVYLVATYRAYKMYDNLHFVFIPSHFYPDLDSYTQLKAWLDTMPTISFRDSCKSSGYEFYASNEMFCVECPVDRLIMMPIPLKDVSTTTSP